MSVATRARARLGSVGVVAAICVLAAGCSVDTGARAGVEAVLAMDHPLILDAHVRGDWLDGDHAFVYLANDATDEDARTAWCDVLVPSGLGERKVPVVVSTLDQKHLWYQPDCSKPKDIPKRQPY